MASEEELSRPRKVALVGSMVACQLVQVSYFAYVSMDTAKDRMR